MKRRQIFFTANDGDLWLAGRSVDGASESQPTERLDNSKSRTEQRRCHAHARRGALFNYIMVYMTVSSVLMTIAGICLHSILRADSRDRRDALFLTSLQRAERQLRDDTLDNNAVLLSPGELSIGTEDGGSVRWQSSRGILTRTAIESGITTAGDRFVFPAGSVIELVAGAEDSIVVRVTEPSAFVIYSTSGSGGSNLSKPAEEASPPTPSHVAQPKTAEIRLRGVQP